MSYGSRSSFGLEDQLAALLEGYRPAVVDRGRRYAADGRVIRLHRDVTWLQGFVQGDSLYEVNLGVLSNRGGRLDAECTCLAFEREGECKHIAAVVLTALRESPREAARDVGQATPPNPRALPPVLQGVYASSVFLSRLPLLSGVRDGGLAAPHGVFADRWSPLVDWWARAQTSKTPRIVAILDQVLAHAPEIARDLETLRRWSPPPPPLPGTAYADVYMALAERYLSRRDDARVRRGAPGPLEGARHPGFDFRYDARLGVFEACERRSALLLEPFRFAFRLSLASRAEPIFDEGASASYGPADAWDLFALREVLLALHARTVDASLALERELGRPVWDHVLEQLGDPARKPAEAREWSFALSRTWGGGDYKLTAFSRRLAVKARSPRWKKESFEALYTEQSFALREIARVALCRMDRSAEAHFALGTPQGHELLRVLARYPHVVLSTAKPNPETDARADIVVGDLTMRLEPTLSGVLAPRFRVGGREIGVSMLSPAERTGLRFATEGAMIASAFVPPALRPWLATAQTMGDAMSFPHESVPQLLATTQALVSAGIVELPREALGTELAFEPVVALRVEWQPEGAAVVHVFVGVHPHAPLVAPGMGPVLFTFERAGERVFVERDLAREVTMAAEAHAHIEAPIQWDSPMTGRTEGLEDALALADYLDRNPLSLAIEIKRGRPPTVVEWGSSTSTIAVRKQGSWLVLDGALDIEGAKLTLGDVLDAARLAQRFVKAADGVFLELSKEAIAKLRPVAIATELGGAADGAAPRIHDGFGSIVAEASALFGEVRGVDLAVYAKRFAARTRPMRVPSLEHGALRPYQRDGVAWMLRLATWAPGCVLADDMGLGKTVQTAAVLKARARLGPQLIVAPASVSSNWIIELRRFMPSLSARWFNDDRELDPAALGPRDVLVVSYGLLQRRSERFEKTRWATVVIDEAQYVKNVSAQRTDAARGLERDFTIALTGTPLENHLGELFSIVDLVFPGLLGAERTFRSRFRRPIESRRDDSHVAVLGRLLEPFLLRRTRAKVLDELPAREEITEYIDLAPAEQKRYLALRRVCEEQFAKRKKQETAAQLKIAVLAALMRLRQLACDVRLVDPTFDGGSTKISRIVELASALASEGNRALVFSQFTQFLTRIRTALEAAGLRVGYLAGETPTTKRRAVIDAFQAGEYDVFCVSLLAGGTGLNLTNANYVIHADPWWNPAAEEQATSRAHRMGQTMPVTVYRLVARGTIEEAVLTMHASKRELAAAVLEGKENAKSITSTELLELLSYGA